MPDLFQLPKYQAAVERENNIRNAAFLNLPHTIGGGCKVMQMTLWHWIILEGCEAPFINSFDIKNPPSSESVLLFLWILSREFYWLNIMGLRTGRFIEWRKKRFAKRFRSLDYAATVAACIAFVHDTFQDSPPEVEQRRKSAPYYSYPAMLTHSLASEYGWNDVSIIRRPLKVVLQLQKIIDIIRQMESGKSPIAFNPSDHVKMIELAEIRAARENSKLHPGQQVAD